MRDFCIKAGCTKRPNKYGYCKAHVPLNAARDAVIEAAREWEHRKLRSSVVLTLAVRALNELEGKK